MRLVVIGGVAAGTKAASRARRVDPDLEITVYQAEPAVSISECGLAYLISGVVEQRDRLVARTPAIIARNLAMAHRWFADHADLVSWTPPRAGLLALMRYHLDIPSLDLANYLAEEHSVMLAPGSAFGYEGHLRLGIGQDPQVFAEGLTRAARALMAVADRRAKGVGGVQVEATG